MESNYKVVYVSTEEQLLQAVADLSTSNAIAFDCEGVDLGRNGPLTIATFSSLGSKAPIYVVDVQCLGGEKVFASSAFKGILESKEQRKIMFDCRSDSDALFHQFGIKLSGVQDMQVMDQAIRIYLHGESLPQRCDYLSPTFIPRLPNMDAVAKRSGLTITKLPSPHMFSSSAWAKRPLDPKLIAYAAQDVCIIKEIKEATRSAVNESVDRALPWCKLEAAVDEHSQRYEGVYRDLEIPLNRMKIADKNLVTEEIALIDSSVLPSNHPNNPPENQSKGKEKWDAVMLHLRANSTSNSLFSGVLFILQHDDWYTNEGLKLVQSLALKHSSFTSKQRERIRNPPALSRWEDESYDCWGDY